MDIQHAKKAFPCECTSSAFVAADMINIEFLWPGPAPRGGQFFLIKPRRTGVFLARPISVAGKGDGGILRFLVAVRGRGSRELADLKPGEEAELIGPLGNSWAGATGLLNGVSNVSGGAAEKPIALVAGGVGIAPLLAFIQELGEKPIPVSRNLVPLDSVPFDLYAGFRTGSFGLEGVKPGSLVIATEDGSRGQKGRIPDFFEPDGYSAVFACGPEPMLKVVGAKCMASDVPCFVSMEKHMACGVGACLGCRVKTKSGNMSCCTDGPVFNVSEIIFDE